MIEVKNLSKTFGKSKVLEHLSLHVEEGSIYGLLGPNGAGKTTLIKHMAGIYKQDGGTVTIGREPVYENPGVKASLLYIPDDLYFFSQYSIDETAKYYSHLYPAWNWERYELLKRAFPIDSKRKITRLSKGMQKQAAFWLGLCIMPRVMLLDEPVDGLDPVMRKQVWNLVLQDVTERRTTVLISSHNLRELEELCDHIGILHEGGILLDCALDTVKADIHKLQVGFSGEIPENFSVGMEILHRVQAGSIAQLIVKGDKESILSAVRQANPVILDILPLTLEEIFIYELGGKGYDIQNILI